MQLFKEVRPTRRISMTKIRPHLTEAIAHAYHHNSKIFITSHGEVVAVLVSLKDFQRIWDAEMFERFGPSNNVDFGEDEGDVAKVEVSEVAAKPRGGWKWMRWLTDKGSA